MLAEPAVRSYPVSILDEHKRNDAHAQAQEPEQATGPVDPQIHEHGIHT